MPGWIAVELELMTTAEAPGPLAEQRAQALEHTHGAEVVGGDQA